MNHNFIGLQHHVVGLIDAAALLTIAGAWLGFLPQIAAGFAIIWYTMLGVSWIANKEWQPKRRPQDEDDAS